MKNRINILTLEIPLIVRSGAGRMCRGKISGVFYGGDVMGYLLNAEWKDGQGLEDLMTWGTDPLLQFLYLFDEEYGQTATSSSGEDEYAVFLYFQMKNIIMDMNMVIERFMDDSRPGAKEKREKRRQRKMSTMEKNLNMVLQLPKDKQSEVKDHLKEMLLRKEKDPEIREMLEKV